MGRWAEEVGSALRADARNRVSSSLGFAWGHRSEKNVVQLFEHTLEFLIIMTAILSDTHGMKFNLLNMIHGIPKFNAIFEVLSLSSL